MRIASGSLFYRGLNGTGMFTVPVETEPALKVGAPVKLFKESVLVSPTGSPRPQS